MMPLSLRRLVGSVGLAIALTTALSVPIGFGLDSYVDEGRMLSFKAHLIAGRLAKYIYANSQMWQYQSIRLAELIRLDDEDEVRQRVIDNAGKTVLEVGDPCGFAHIRRSAPIIVSGEQIGQVEIETCLNPLLKKIGLIALFSFALGFGVYFTVRTFPLRVLDRTLGDLETAKDTIQAKNTALEAQNQTLQAREVELRSHNYRFHLALDSMSQGLCMFDGGHRLIVCNERYAWLYALPPALTQAGTPLRAILEHRLANGCASADLSPEQYVAKCVAIADSEQTLSFVVDLADGRSIAVLRGPMAGGGWVATHEDVTERRQSEAQIAHMARHDALTDLPNRVLLREQIERALDRQRRNGEGFAVLCLDLDRFKAVNDTLGHPAGDALLRAVAMRLKGCLRETDIVARLGGDEFAILQVAHDQPRGASALAKRIVDVIDEPFSLDGQQVIVGASVGVALAPADGSNPDMLFKNADLALYRAKSDGGGRCCFFEAEMDARVQARRSLELDLRNAYRNGEFELFYQPLISLASDEVSGFEALIRWRHPERGMISPAAFVPVAEDIGLIGPLGEWVIQEACRQAARWPESIKVAVNLSPDQFKKGCGLVEAVRRALTASNLSPRRLELEITESVLLADDAETLATLHQLRALGARIVLDDFGTGYSSLSYLRKFPFDKIKIDQSFVRELSTREDCSAIVRMVMTLARTLGIATVAEGVETVEHLERLRAEGCSEVQGFLFSPPRPSGDVERLIRACRAETRAAA